MKIENTITVRTYWYEITADANNIDWIKDNDEFQVVCWDFAALYLNNLKIEVTRKSVAEFYAVAALVQMDQEAMLADTLSNMMLAAYFNPNLYIVEREDDGLTIVSEDGFEKMEKFQEIFTLLNDEDFNRYANKNNWQVVKKIVTQDDEVPPTIN